MGAQKPLAAVTGQPCARCGMKWGAHEWKNRHPRACSEWLTKDELREEIERADELWFFDMDGKP